MAIYDACVFRFTVDGELDPTFGDPVDPMNELAGKRGWNTSLRGLGFGSIEALALQEDGRIVGAGYCSDGAYTTAVCLTRYTPNGVFDTSFDGDGHVVKDLFHSTVVATADIAYGVAVQDDLKIVAAARCDQTAHFCLLRFDETGALDTTFSDDGVSENTVSHPHAAPTDMVLQPDGRILVAGYCGNVFLFPVNLNFCVSRYNLDGSLDVTFGPLGGGWAGAAVMASNTPQSIELQTDGKLVAGGDCGTFSTFGGCIARFRAHCAMDGDCDDFANPQQTLHRGPANTVSTLDNCPIAANPDQLNADGNFVDASPPYAPAIDDRTHPSSDAQGDACDIDDDNDGIADTVEQSGPPCVTTGAATNPFLRDTDGDRYLDGAECLLGSNATFAGVTPTVMDCANHLGVTLATDTDGDKVRDYIELCFYNSDPNAVDSDGDAALDGAKDGCEMASYNGDRIVNSLDQAMLAQGILGVVVYHANIDINKDGALNSIDQALQAQYILPPGQCP